MAERAKLLAKPDALQAIGRMVLKLQEGLRKVL